MITVLSWKSEQNFVKTKSSTNEVKSRMGMASSLVQMATALQAKKANESSGEDGGNTNPTHCGSDVKILKRFQRRALRLINGAGGHVL